MRRKDREMTPEFAWDLIDRCEYGVLAMNGETGTPYCIPLTAAREQEQIYFHGAMAGRKYEILKNAPRVCMTFVGKTEIQEELFTTRYESAVVFGRVTELTDPAKKTAALRVICQRHTPHAMDRFEGVIARNLDKTAVYRLDVDEITGKCKQ